MNILDLLIAFAMLGLTEAVIKPLAKRFIQRRLLAAAPAILREVDRRLPELIQLPTGEALEARVRELAEQATEESWSSRELDELFSLFDLRKAIKP
jgi:hypothetical protein